MIPRQFLSGISRIYFDEDDSVGRDFRPHYPESVTDSRERGMYRQNYCGCRFSAAEAALERQAMRDWRKAAKAARREGRELPPRPDFFPG